MPLVSSVESSTRSPGVSTAGMTAVSPTMKSMIRALIAGARVRRCRQFVVALLPPRSMGKFLSSAANRAAAHTLKSNLSIQPATAGNAGHQCPPPATVSAPRSSANLFTSFPADLKPGRPFHRRTKSSRRKYSYLCRNTTGFHHFTKLTCANEPAYSLDD